MRFPIHIATDMMKWQLRNWWRGNARYPSVLMLEPLHTCNLACLGCSPERYSGDLKDRLSLAQCLEAVDEAGAPVVSICGGEPTIYPELAELIDAIVARKRHIYLCTNGLLLDRFYKRGHPHKRLSINVHLDGMRATHDLITDRPGTFDRAIEMIKEGQAARLRRVHQHDDLPRDVDGRDRGDVRAAHRARRRRHADLARLSLRGHRGGPLPPSRRDPPPVPARARALEALSHLLHAALPAVRRRPARLPVHAVGHADPDARRAGRAPAT